MRAKQGDFAPLGEPMTLLADERPLARRLALDPDGGTGSLALSLGATLLTLAMAAGVARGVLSGGFSDPDDAMRLVEVRAWLGGQGWYDLAAHRLDPPLGASMHWSRLVDLPMGAAIHLLSPFVDITTAERWARIAVPACWLLALYLGLCRLATLLAGRSARAVVVLGTMLGGAALVSFVPGRIGHHAPETVVLVLALGAALASFDAAQARQAAVAGALVALGLAMSLETLPLLAGLCAAMATLWIVRGAAVARALAWFGVGLGLALPALFLATVAPGHRLATTCDAFGAPHLCVGLVGAAGAFALASISTRLATPLRRAAAAAVLGALVGGILVGAFPACLRSPFAGVDPLVRAIWLDNVVESKPLVAFAYLHPTTAVALVAPMLLGLLGSLHAATTARGTAAARFAAVAALTGLGLALTVWQVRVFASVAPLALLGSLPVVRACRDRLAARGLARLAGAAPLLVLPFASTAWAIALPDDGGAVGPAKAACLAPSSIAPLAALGPGRAVAPIDLGSHLLVMTPLDVFAAPYHRNDDGNRFMIDVFSAAPARAQALLASRDTRFVLTCGDETARLAARAPDGLAARLRAGDVPGFLRRLSVPRTPYAVYRVMPPAEGSAP